MPRQRLLSFDVGVRHLAFADVDVDDDGTPIRIHAWDVLDLSDDDASTRSAPTPDTRDVVTRVIDALDARLFDPDAHWDVVLIENQPVLMNPRMKTVQVAIHTYFAVLARFVHNVGSVKLVSASVKARAFCGPDGAKVEPAATPSTAAATPTTIDGSPAPPTVAATTKAKASLGARYRDRKACAIQSAKHYVARLGDAERVRQLANSKKKDDLADCLLQAIAYQMGGVIAVDRKKRSKNVKQQPPGA
jgi:hypothetical protein